MSVPTFIVGTGRCGSTMLSNMLREHPKVLSLSEFFAMVSFHNGSAATFSAEPLVGLKFWSMLALISPMAQFCSRNRIVAPEQLYDRDAPGAQFSWETGVPTVMEVTLPHLANDPDQLFEKLQSEVSQWPVATVGDHYVHLFTWLAAHFSKLVWVERSGVSLPLVSEIQATFPTAKFVHMIRDGRDAAMSMHQNLGLKFAVGMSALRQHLGVDPIDSSDRSRIDQVPQELLGFLPESFDAEAIRAFDVPLRLCGQFWTQQLESGRCVLNSLPDDRLLTLRYEDFFVDPKHQLDKLAAFLGEDYIDEDWSARCAATVRKPRSTWRDLPEEDARALTEACRPGFELLRAADVEYEV